MEQRELFQHRAPAGIAAAASWGAHTGAAPVATAAAGAAALPTVDDLGAEIAELKRQLAQAAPRRAVAEMDRAIAVLHQQVEDLQQAGGAAAISYLADELAALHATLEAERAPDRFAALEAGLELLAQRISILSAKAVDPLEMARLQAHSAELRDLVMRAVSGTGLQPIVDRLAACAEEIARSGSETQQRVAEAASRFERKSEALLTRFDAFEAQARGEQAASTKELRHEVAAQVRGLHGRLDQLSTQLADMAPTDEAAVAACLGQLLDRVEAVESHDRALVQPLTEVVEHHLVSLTERIQAASAQLGRLDDMENVLAHMIDEMQRVRESADVAARDAAAAVARKVSAHADGPAVVGLKRGLAALEARQSEVERRASELLGEAIGRGLEERTVVLGRTADDVWAAHPEWPHPERATGTQEGPGERTSARRKAEPGGGPEVDPLSFEARVTAEEVAGHWRRREASARPGPAPDASEAGAAHPRTVRRMRRQAGGSATGAAARTDLPQRDKSGHPRRWWSMGARLSPVAIATVGVAAALAMALGAGWTHRAAIEARATQVLNRLKEVAVTRAAAVAPKDLPAPIGPQALRAAALEGNPAAAYEVGVRLTDGMETDLAAGIKWLDYAVSLGSAPAAYRLGRLYESRLHNGPEAARLYTWAAEQGNVRAMHNLGVLYSQGVTGVPDWGQAIAWFRKAADRGVRDSQHNLGIILAYGLGGSTDLTEALTWLSIAASQGDRDSAVKRDSLAREASETQRAEARKAAAGFVPKPTKEVANAVAALPEWRGADHAQVASNVLYSQSPVALTGLQ